MRARIDEKLASFGLAGDARDWVVKALDPATAGPAPGIPDTSTQCVLRPEFRVQATIQSPTSGGNWDCYIFVPPGDMNCLVWATAPSGAGNVNFAAGPGSVPAGAAWGAVQLQPFVDGTGFTSLNVQGPATASYTSVDVASRTPASLATTFRHQYKSVTIEMVAPDIANQGDVYAAQYPSVPRNTRFTNVGSQTNTIGPTILGANVSQVPLPFNEADLTLSSPNAYVGRAKDGLYMPLRLQGPVQSFCEVNTPAVGSWFAPPFIATTGPAPVLFPENTTVQFPRLMIPCQNDTAGEVSAPALGTLFSDSWVANGLYAGPSANGACDTGHDQTMMGVIIFRGLASSGGTGGPSFGATLVIKVLAGLEVIPRPTSVERVFQKAPAAYSPRALEAYYGISNALPPAFPASYNALGALLPVLGSVASALWPSVRAGLTAFRTGLADVIRPSEAAPPRAAIMPRETITVRERVVPRARSSSRVRAASVTMKVGKRRKRKALVPR